ncbi:hypothetical protein GCM10027346_21480 [Hymenobacter seoulensis]
MSTSAAPLPAFSSDFNALAKRKKPATPASERRQLLFDLTSEAALLAARTFGTYLQPEHVFQSSIENLQPVDIAFAASYGCQIELEASIQRLPDGRITALIMPQLAPQMGAAAVSIDADFTSASGPLPGSSALTDLEVEIYLRTDEDRLIDLLDFSEISEEADEDGYVVGYVALAHLLRHREVLRKYGAFLVRTGNVRPVSANEYSEEAA